MKIITTGRKIDHTLQFRDLRFHREEIGKIPNDIFLPTDQTPPLDSLKHSRPVIVNQPEMIDGEPNVREVSKRFQASAPSPVVGGVVGGFGHGGRNAFGGGSDDHHTARHAGRSDCGERAGSSACLPFSFWRNNGKQ